MPLFAWINGAGHTITECILLQPVVEKSDSYTRAGVLRVSVDLRHELPGDLRWIADVFLSPQNLGDLETIFVY